MRKLLFVATVFLIGLVVMAADGQYARLYGKATPFLINMSDSSVSRDSMAMGIGSVAGWNTLRGRVILNPSSTTSHGIGLDDSGYIWLYTYYVGTDDRVLLDSTAVDYLPCTLSVVVPSSVGDTLLRNYLQLKVMVYDTTADTNFVVVYPVDYTITLK
jgi:hypothetical protein